MELDPVVELYGLAPEQFTAARNQLAKTLRDAGDTRGIETIRALRKPTVAAWLANRLVRTVPDQIAELTEFGEDLREAHRLGDRTRLKALTTGRHELVGHLVEVARANAAHAGRSITMTTAERIAATLDAALVDPGAAQLLRSGRLTSGLRHVGFGVVDETGTPIPVTHTECCQGVSAQGQPDEEGVRPEDKKAHAGRSAAQTTRRAAGATARGRGRLRSSRE